MALLLDAPSVKRAAAPAERRLDIPLPLSAESWLHLRSHLRTFTVSVNVQKSLWRPEPSYLLPLTGAATLFYPRLSEPFGRRIVCGMVWPLQVRREGSVTTHTRRPTQVGWLLETTLRRVMTFSAELRHYFTRQILLTQITAVQELLIYDTATAKERLIHMLLKLDEDKDMTAIHCTHEMLGLLVKMRRETVSHLIGKLRRERLISTSYRRIQIRDHERLTALVAHL